MEDPSSSATTNDPNDQAKAECPQNGAEWGQGCPASSQLQRSDRICDLGPPCSRHPQLTSHASSVDPATDPDPIAVAREYGLDISLLEENLRRTPAERLRARRNGGLRASSASCLRTSSRACVSGYLLRHRGRRQQVADRAAIPPDGPARQNFCSRWLWSRLAKPLPKRPLSRPQVPALSAPADVGLTLRSSPRTPSCVCPHASDVETLRALSREDQRPGLRRHPA